MAQFQRNDKGIGYLTLSLAELIKYSENIEPICDNCGRKLQLEEQITLVPICNEAFCKECGTKRLSAVRDYIEDRPIRKHREDFYKEWFNLTEEDDGKVTVVFDIKGSERDLNGRPCTKAEYTYTIENGILCIVDLDKGNRSVTNDIENVLADIEAAEGKLDDLKGIIYKDSMSIWSRVLIIDGLVYFKTLGFPSKKNAIKQIRGEAW